MAFTPDGMFYLSQKDFQPSMDTLGGAVRGMFGLQNKEEAVNAILQSADYDTHEGRRAALDQIRGIDPDRWAGLNKQNIEFEKGELENLSKRGEPALQKAWKDSKAPVYTTTWVANNLGFYNLTEAIDEVLGGKQPTTEADVTNLLMWLAKNDDNLESGKAGMLKASYISMLKTAKSDYMTLNKYNPPKVTKPEQTRDLSSIKGRGERVVPPPTAAAAAGVETQPGPNVGKGFEVERRLGKDVKVYKNWGVKQAPPLTEEEAEVLGDKFPGMF